MVTVIHPRQKIIIPFRLKLSRELFNDTLFNTYLENVFNKSKNLLKLKQQKIFNMIEKNSQLYLGCKLNSSESTQIKKIIVATMYSAKLLAPFYESYAYWFYSQIEDRIKKKKYKLIFSGRDSYPYKLALNLLPKMKKKTHKMIYLPFNRGNIIHLYRRCYNPQYTQVEIKSIVDFYINNKLLNNRLIVCDFGFFGTLERTHQLILFSEKLIKKNILFSHLVVVKMKRSATDKTVFDKAIDPRSFEFNKLKRLVKTDRNYYSQIHGFFNSGLINTNNFFKLNGDLLINMDKTFIYWLQEIGSGIEESRHYILQDRSKDYLSSTNVKLASIQQLTAYLTFLKVLPDFLTYSNNVDPESLENFYKEYKENLPFWQQLIAYEDRASIDMTFKYEKLLKNINKELGKHNFHPISIPFDA